MKAKPDKLLTISDAAKRFGVGIRTIVRWDHEGFLTPDKVSGGRKRRRFYLESSLERKLTELCK